MIGLFLWLVLLGYPALYVLALVKNKTWKARTLWCALLSIPLVAYFWDYPLVKYRHDEACATDGGLKVFKKPDRMDRVLSKDRSIADSILYHFYPAIQAVEAGDGTTKDGVVRDYFLYTVDPAVANESDASGQRRKLKLIKTPITPTAKDIYTLRHIHESRPQGRKDRYLLERNGNVYAQWTEYEMTWNAGGVFRRSWQCYTMTGTGRLQEENLIKLLVE